MRRRLVPHRLDPALALRRRPAHRRAVVALVAALCGVAVANVVRQAEDAAADWGTSVPVLVATRDLDAGEVLDPGTTTVVLHPRPLVAAGTLTSTPDDARLTQPVYAGEAIREERLAPKGLSAVAARLPEGMRAVAIPAEPAARPTLEVGDRVDVLVALGAEAMGEGPPGFVLSRRAQVLEVTDVAVTVAVPADVAPRVAVALGAGAVTLALDGAP